MVVAGEREQPNRLTRKTVTAFRFTLILAVDVTHIGDFFDCLFNGFGECFARDFFRLRQAVDTLDAYPRCS